MDGFDPWESELEPVLSAGHIPVPFVERSLVLPNRTFRVELLGGGTTLAESDGLGRIFFSARAAITHAIEVELELLRADLSPTPGYGLRQPRLGLRVRLLEGPFEVAVGLGSEIPVDGDLTVDGGVETRLHIGGWARWDLRAGANSRRPVTADGEADAQADTELWFQLGPRLALGGMARLRGVELFDVNTLSGQAGAGIAWTVGVSKQPGFGDEKKRAQWELIGLAWSPEEALVGESLALPRIGEAWSGFLLIRWFFVNLDRDPFAD
ncbi:MAG: hypothetical protein ACFB9M_16620 [Myxococcota bacterium]